MFLLLEIGSMSASVMQLHHFMFKDSNFVKSGEDRKLQKISIMRDARKLAIITRSEK